VKIRLKRNRQLKRDGYELDLTVNGRRYRQWFATHKEATDAAAQLTLNKRARKIGLPMPSAQQGITVDALYLARQRECHTLPSWPASRAHLLDFIAGLPVGCRLDAITPAHVADYLSELQARGLRNNTINLYLGKIVSFFNSAARHFPDCAWTPPVIKFLPSEPTTDCVLSGPELVKLYRTLTSATPLNPHELPSARKRRREEFADLFLACFLTGARYDEVLQLTWQNVRFDLDTLALNATKTRTRRTLPLTATLRELLTRRQQTHSAAPFAKDFSLPTLHRCMAHAGEAAQIPYGERTGWTLKTLRHTAITTMLRARADFLSVQACVGHAHNKNQSITLHYAHVSLDGMREALQTLETHWLKACQDFDDLTRHKPVKTRRKA